MHAYKHLGLTEIRDDANNPEIVAMFADVGHPRVKDDETAWCAAFCSPPTIDTEKR